MQKREESWRKKFQELYSKIVKQKIPVLGSPDAEVNCRWRNGERSSPNRFFRSFQEGPHSTLKEDEFYDAIDQSLDRLDRETDDYRISVSIALMLEKNNDQSRKILAENE